MFVVKVLAVSARCQNYINKSASIMPTPWYRIIFEKLIVTHLIKNSIMEPEGSSPCSQKPTTGPYPEPVEPSSHFSPIKTSNYTNFWMPLQKENHLLVVEGTACLDFSGTVHTGRGQPYRKRDSESCLINSAPLQVQRMEGGDPNHWT
jgi:hypothetical protein